LGRRLSSQKPPRNGAGSDVRTRWQTAAVDEGTQLPRIRAAKE